MICHLFVYNDTTQLNSPNLAKKVFLNSSVKTGSSSRPPDMKFTQKIVKKHNRNLYYAVLLTCSIFSCDFRWLLYSKPFPGSDENTRAIFSTQLYSQTCQISVDHRMSEHSFITFQYPLVISFVLNPWFKSLNLINIGLINH